MCPARKKRYLAARLAPGANRSDFSPKSGFPECLQYEIFSAFDPDDGPVPSPCQEGYWQPPPPPVVYPSRLGHPKLRCAPLCETSFSGEKIHDGRPLDQTNLRGLVPSQRQFLSFQIFVLRIRDNRVNDQVLPSSPATFTFAPYRNDPPPLFLKQ